MWFARFSPQHCSDSMANVRDLFEYFSYAFAIRKKRSATTESHLSAIIIFHRISRGFNLDTLPIPSVLVPSKVLLVRTQMWVTKHLCAGPFRGPCCWLTRC